MQGLPVLHYQHDSDDDADACPLQCTQDHDGVGRILLQGREKMSSLILFAVGVLGIILCVAFTIIVCATAYDYVRGVIDTWTRERR